MSTENDVFPVLYLLMRNDLPSMNPGKAMAQASHASNAFVGGMMDVIYDGGDSFVPDLTPLIDLFHQWKNSTPQNFGTVLVLAVNEKEMNNTVNISKELGFAADVIHDPTYPILVPPELGEALVDRDVEFDSPITVGERHNYVTIPLDTCAYIFGNKNDPMLEAIVGRFPLHP